MREGREECQSFILDRALDFLRYRFLNTVQDEVFLPNSSIQFFYEPADLSCGTDSSDCRVRNDQQIVNVLGCLPAEVLHPRLVIDHDIFIIGPECLQDVPQQIVDITVASWTFWSAHGYQIKIGLFHEAGLDLVFEKLLFCHPTTHSKPQKDADTSGYLNRIHIHYYWDVAGTICDRRTYVDESQAPQ